MGLLAPWFLLGLAAIALPVYVHLLRQYRSTPLKFSSLMFFERHTQSSIQHRRLRYLLLFSLRALLFALLALAFANPFLKRPVAALSSGRKLIVVAIDNSFSMRVGNRLAAAKQEAATLLSRWTQGDQGEIVAFASSVQALTQASPDPGTLRAALQGVEQTDARGSFAGLARSVRSIAQASKLPVEVHLFSDMQSSSLPASFADLQLGGNVRLVAHPVATSRLPNWTVESVSAPHRVQDTRKTKVQAIVAGYGTLQARRNASLVVNGRVVETKPVDVPANGRAPVEFLSLDVPHGLARCEVRIDAADGLPGDDQFYFSVERNDPSRVLLVHEAHDGRSPVYVRAALDASVESAFALEAITAEQSANASPSRYAVVLLSNTGPLPPEFAAALTSYVKAGGGLFIAAGAATPANIPVFDEAVKGAKYAGREGERFQTAADVDSAHPALRNVNKFENVKFYQVMRIEAGKARVLARLGDQTPLLLAKQVGEGRVLVLASTFDNISNDLPLHASFVPFVEQALSFLAGRDANPSAYLVDSHYALRTAKERGVAVEVRDPEGKRPLSLGEATTADSVQLARQGFYELRTANGRQALAAVNADRRESDLDVLPAETVALWQNTGQEAVSGGGQEESKPFSLWWYIMLAVFLSALAGIWIGSRYLEAEREET